jgi:general stress protein 26
MNRYDSHDSRAKLAELIDGIHVAMLTTIDRRGHLRSRPMGSHGIDDTGRLTFFTSLDQELIQEATTAPVSVSYAHVGKNAYVSVSGHAALDTDRATIKALWKPEFKAWYEGGSDDPTIALLRVSIESAEYWKTPGGPLTKLAEFAKAATGNPPGTRAEHAKI